MPNPPFRVLTPNQALQFKDQQTQSLDNKMIGLVSMNGLPMGAMPVGGVPMNGVPMGINMGGMPINPMMMMKKG